MKQQLLQEIMLEMVNIYHLGKGHFKHEQKHILAALVRANQKKFGLEWDAEIIRDETYYTTWKALVKFSDDYTEGELRILLDQMRNTEDAAKVELKIFLSSIKRYVELDVKTHILSDSRKNSDRTMIDAITEATDFTGLDYLFAIDYQEEQQLSHFTKWCSDNWQTVLTAKQKAYVSNDCMSAVNDSMTKAEKNNVWANESKMRNRISKRLLDKYEQQYGKDRKKAETQAKIEKLEEILDSKDFVSALLYNHETDFIIEAIYDYVSKPQIIVFNRATHNKVPVPAETIKIYRSALFKALKGLYAELGEEN